MAISGLFAGWMKRAKRWRRVERPVGEFPQSTVEVHTNPPFVHPAEDDINHRYAIEMLREVGESSSVGVDQFADGSQIAPQLLVLLGLFVDLVASMENR